MKRVDTMLSSDVADERPAPAATARTPTEVVRAGDRREPGGELPGQRSAELDAAQAHRLAEVTAERRHGARRRRYFAPLPVVAPDDGVALCTLVPACGSGPDALRP